MKLDQIIKDESGTHYIYKCEVCGGQIISSELKDEVCPFCDEWANKCVEEVEKANEDDRRGTD